jgi:hypothetical protein
VGKHVAVIRGMFCMSPLSPAGAIMTSPRWPDWHVITAALTDWPVS